MLGTEPSAIAENRFKALVKKLLDEAGAWHAPMAAGGMGGQAGLPDRFAVLDGRAWALELKGCDWGIRVQDWRARSPTRLQTATLFGLSRAGATAMVVGTPGDAVLLARRLGRASGKPLVETAVRAMRAWPEIKARGLGADAQLKIDESED